MIEVLSFNLPAISCVWEDWTIGECTTTCGPGQRTDSRSKLVEEANGGNCTGETTRTEECNTKPCPGNNKKIVWPTSHLLFSKLLKTDCKYCCRSIVKKQF